MSKFCRTTLFLGFCCVALLSGCTSQNNLYQYYISPSGDDDAVGTCSIKPFATIQRARDAVRNLRKSGPLDHPVTVYLRGGEYVLDEPVVFTPEDGGVESSPITYAAYPGEKPVITAGRRITGWQKGPGDLWQVQLPDVAAGKWNFRRLFINGDERPRSRIPNEGFFTVAGFPDGGKEVSFITRGQRFEYAPGDIDPAWSDLHDGVVIAFHYWIEEHMPIEAVDPEKHIVSFRTKSAVRFTDCTGEVGARYIVENIFEGVDQPGEWCLNTKTGILSYFPMPGENPNDCRCIAPAAEGFIHFQGDPLANRFVEHLNFENLTFAYSHYDLADGQTNSVQAACSVPGAIVLDGVRHCRFDHCSVIGAGGYAFDLQNGCSDNQFTNNKITLSGAGGFRISGGNFNEHPLLRTGVNTIADNEIGQFGQVFKSAIGVLIMHSEGNTVIHNHIHHGWYSGVSIGWNWGYARSISRDNIIDFNHIHHIGQGLLSDMGGIYTLGVSPGTTIRNNLIHDVDAFKYGGWGIYNDEGSTAILIENNVVHDTKYSAYHMHYGKEVTIRNNIFTFAKLDQIARSIREQHLSLFFENNIVYWTEGKLLWGNWGDKPYDYYVTPHGEKIQNMDKTFASDYNCFYNPNLTADQLDFDGDNLDTWQKRGYDQHSLYTDPMFVDAAHRDFRLKPDSPVFQLGFKPIDMTTVGPRSTVGPEN